MKFRRKNQSRRQKSAQKKRSDSEEGTHSVAKPIPVPAACPKAASYADEEVIEFGGGPAKRPRPSMPQQPVFPLTPPATVTLSLPVHLRRHRRPSLAPSNSNPIPKLTMTRVAYGLGLEQDIFRDVFGERDGDEEERGRRRLM